ncbi:MAG: hypothetical protein AAGJ18_21255 [Bacteroidota bacterium]
MIPNLNFRPVGLLKIQLVFLFVNFLTMKVSTSDKIHLALLTATIAGLMIAIVHNGNQHTALLQQMKLSSFSAYTQRYEKIILSFPEEIHSPNFELNTLPKEERDRILKYMRAYFDLCSEEYYLGTEGLIDDYIWQQWKGGIRMNMSKPAFRQAWAIIINDMAFDKDFVKMIEGM